jgi:hypothetical protein
MNTLDTTAGITPVPAVAADRATPRRRSRIGGLLPYIGVILFLASTAWHLLTGTLTGQLVLSEAVMYLIGWAGVGAGVTHIVFGARIAKTIGFVPNDFQTEVGFANLAMGITALCAGAFGPQYALAVILVSSIFRVGAGFVHIRSMVRTRNFAINNTAILGVNFLVPVFLLIAYSLWG